MSAVQRRATAQAEIDAHDAALLARYAEAARRRRQACRRRRSQSPPRRSMIEESGYVSPRRLGRQSPPPPSSRRPRKGAPTPPPPLPPPASHSTVLLPRRSASASPPRDPLPAASVASRQLQDIGWPTAPVSPPPLRRPAWCRQGSFSRAATHAAPRPAMPADTVSTQPSPLVLSIDASLHHIERCFGRAPSTDSHRSASASPYARPDHLPPPLGRPDQHPPPLQPPPAVGAKSMRGVSPPRSVACMPAAVAAGLDTLGVMGKGATSWQWEPGAPAAIVAGFAVAAHAAAVSAAVDAHATAVEGLRIAAEMVGLCRAAAVRDECLQSPPRPRGASRPSVRTLSPRRQMPAPADDLLERLRSAERQIDGLSPRGRVHWTPPRSPSPESHRSRGVAPRRTSPAREPSHSSMPLYSPAAALGRLGTGSSVGVLFSPAPSGTASPRRSPRRAPPVVPPPAVLDESAARRRTTAVARGLSTIHAQSVMAVRLGYYHRLAVYLSVRKRLRQRAEEARIAAAALPAADILR
eukprot:TRINITY_DN48494_c0_g1_i1.p1 TRINITY_DN48494_c0_g1~~TRINITY_DN48494_c0_g1_i1.p1  ORF type:complete len:541 (+),score=165.50 TRINITY_DN48494_c0_g1_i1:52-1623(+)